MSISSLPARGADTVGPRVRIVVAYADNRTIGRDNTLPWRLPGDMAHFRRTTMGLPIIMGRKTWESLGRPLPGRHNIVISRNPQLQANGATLATSLPDALRAAGDQDAVCIIGGAQIYAQALPLADDIVATEVHADVEGDAVFPQLDETQWQEIQRDPQPPENGLHYDFVVYRRRTAPGDKAATPPLPVMDA